MNFLLTFTLIVSTLFTPTVQAAPLIREFTLGYSAQGRPIDVVQIGDGPRKLVVVGATHGAPEANTYRLTLELIDYFRANPQAVPPSVRLYFIPVINPDGLALGTRFDALGVDLNRNMNTTLDACPENDWSITVQGARGIVSNTGGPYPDSQIESRLIRAFLLDASGVIFLHSNAGLVFPAFCEHAPSLAMAETYALAAGYTYSRYWSTYNITGSMADWAGSMGIAAITPELITGDQSEFPQNLAGLQAVLANAETILLLPADNEIDGIPVPAAIYRYWRALGGSERFGVPLAPAFSVGNDLHQPFTKVVLVQRAAYADTPSYVQPAPLGQEAAQAVAFAGGDAFGVGDPANNPLFFEETGHGLKLAFLDLWQRGGGVDVFGLPLSEEFVARAADGQIREMQYFERAILAYYPEDGSVRLEPLGVRYQALAALQQPLAAQMAR